MYRLLFFVVVITVVSCFIVKKLGKRYNATSRQQFWAGIAIPVVGILVYEWFDHHRDLLKRMFGRVFGNKNPFGKHRKVS